ncbi:MAG: hypothetical protein ACREMY_31675, partial [bacterium]
AMMCRSLASRLSREADTVDRELRTSYSQRANNYMRMAAAYEMQASARSGAKPYAGGISIADKKLDENNPDRVPPQFNIGMQDSLLPVAPVGNELATNVQADESGSDE